MNDFRSFQTKVLITTNVLARGATAVLMCLAWALLQGGGHPKGRLENGQKP
jgi:hypothetical protein